MYKSWVKPPLWNLAGLIFKWGGIFLSFEVGNCVSNANFKWKENVSSNEALKELKCIKIILFWIMLIPKKKYCRSGIFCRFNFSILGFFARSRIHELSISMIGIAIIIITFRRFLNLWICPPCEIRGKYNLANITRSTVHIYITSIYINEKQKKIHLCLRSTSAILYCSCLLFPVCRYATPVSRTLPKKTKKCDP